MILTIVRDRTIVERGPPEMFSLRRIIFRLAAGLLLPLTTGVLPPEAMPVPSGQVILTVSGDITAVTHGDAARSDPKMLRQLPWQDFGTMTIRTNCDTTCVGVPLSALPEHPGPTQGRVTARAIDDHAVHLIVSEPGDDAMIIASISDGEPMSRRDKGPFGNVAPFGRHERYRTEVTYSNSVWQPDRIIVTRQSDRT